MQGHQPSRKTSVCFISVTRNKKTAARAPQTPAGSSCACFWLTVTIWLHGKCYPACKIIPRDDCWLLLGTRKSSHLTLQRAVGSPGAVKCPVSWGPAHVRNSWMTKTMMRLTDPNIRHTESNRESLGYYSSSVQSCHIATHRVSGSSLMLWSRAISRDSVHLFISTTPRCYWECKQKGGGQTLYWATLWCKLDQVWLVWFWVRPSQVWWFSFSPTLIKSFCSQIIQHISAKMLNMTI